ncbi:MAG: universal stress protein [Sulfolobaceae archaeon]|nr:universal stress protein [Sulfolobaceae archaeon]
MKVVVGYDGSEQARRAITFAKNILIPLNTQDLKPLRQPDEIHIVTVINEPKQKEEQVILNRENAKEIQLEALNELKGYNVKAEIVEGKNVSDAILNVCYQIGCDMIIVGSRGLTGVKGAILGSVSSELLAKSKVPLLIVK